MAKTIRKRTETCPRCPVACKMIVEVKEGPFAPVFPEYGGPEYENMAALGSLLGIDRLDAVSRMNMLCNAYSLDTISASVCIAFATCNVTTHLNRNGVIHISYHMRC